MRVIAGELKGRRLRSPDWSGLRPSSDRLRETLFNILRDVLSDATVLDGFAGTGALGIEAISRGAGLVVFVDDDRRAITLIAQNLEQCGVTDRAHLVQARLPAALQNDHPNLTQPFDLILLDPPYDDPMIDEILSAVPRRLAPDGLLVVEGPRRLEPRVVTGLEHRRRVRSGDSALDFYRRAAGDQTPSRE